MILPTCHYYILMWWGGVNKLKIKIAPNLKTSKELFEPYIQKVGFLGFWNPQIILFFSVFPQNILDLGSKFRKLFCFLDVWFEHWIAIGRIKITNDYSSASLPPSGNESDKESSRIVAMAYIYCFILFRVILFNFGPQWIVHFHQIHNSNWILASQTAGWRILSNIHCQQRRICD